MSCKKETKNIDFLEIAFCPPSPKEGDSKCDGLTLGLDMQHGRDPDFLRVAARMVIGTIDSIAKLKPYEFINVSFKDTKCGGGNLTQFQGHEVVFQEFERHFKGNTPRLGFAHDYIDLSFRKVL